MSLHMSCTNLETMYLNPIKGKYKQKKCWATETFYDVKSHSIFSLHQVHKVYSNIAESLHKVYSEYCLWPWSKQSILNQKSTYIFTFSSVEKIEHTWHVSLFILNELWFIWRKLKLMTGREKGKGKMYLHYLRKYSYKICQLLVSRRKENETIYS